MSFVYVIEATPGLVKIGISDNPKLRLRGVQTGCPYVLTLVAQFKVSDARFVERFIHEQFHAERLQGEWFAVASSRAIEAVKAACEIPPLRDRPDRYFRVLCWKCGRKGVALVPGKIEKPRFRCSICGSNAVLTKTKQPSKPRPLWDHEWRPKEHLTR